MTQADRIIGKFGGLAPLARALGHRYPTTVQGWKERGFIPPKHHEQILRVARETGIAIEPREFLTFEAETAA